MGIGPKSLGERAAFEKLVEITPDAGDVLIVKQWSNSDRAGDKDEDAVHIRYGQALGSRVPGGSMNSEHVCIYVGNGKICEANGMGVRQSQMDARPKLLYRCRNTQLAQEAADVASILAGVTATRMAKTLKKAGYDWNGAKASVFRMKFYGAKTEQFLSELYYTVYPTDATNFPDPPKMFCSEFVTACYEVAAMKLKTTALHVDPKAMSPKALEGALSRSPLFENTGRAGSA
jgi:hypothetical protein